VELAAPTLADLNDVAMNTALRVIDWLKRKDPVMAIHALLVLGAVLIGGSTLLFKAGVLVREARYSGRAACAKSLHNARRTTLEIGYAGIQKRFMGR
jgi:hypothetical protein